MKIRTANDTFGLWFSRILTASREVLAMDAPSAPTVCVPLEAGKERILVVDDNTDGADSTALLMELYGYAVRVAYDFSSAMSKAVQFIPHVALLDLSEPQPDGLRLAKKFQAMAETRKTILIALSGYGQPGDIERTRQAGFARHFVKPADLELIHKTIQSMRLRGS
jgi:two-component system, chemotaxis family, CheB/CheR fusion protein